MLKYLYLIILISFPVISQNKKLVWSEEFDSETIDTATWNFEKGFGHNNEEQYYTSRENNIRIENGDLVIEERKSTNRQVSPQQG
jgi:hypothetical protein